MTPAVKSGLHPRPFKLDSDKLSTLSSLQALKTHWWFPTKESGSILYWHGCDKASHGVPRELHRKPAITRTNETYLDFNLKAPKTYFSEWASSLFFSLWSSDWFEVGAAQLELWTYQRLVCLLASDSYNKCWSRSIRSVQTISLSVKLFRNILKLWFMLI